jgi:hypothetical protein
LSDKTIASFGANEPWRVDDTDLKRQAIGSIAGYEYQIHSSAAAWLDLQPDGRLQLEVVEDFSTIAKQILTGTQVKATHRSRGVTLNSKEIKDAIESLFRLTKVNEGRDVRLAFVTTSRLGREAKDPLPSKSTGIEAWRSAASGGDVTEIRQALRTRFPSGELSVFLDCASDDELRSRLLTRLTFLGDAPATADLEEKNLDRLVDFRHEVKATASAARSAYPHVVEHILKTIARSQTRELRRKDLIALLERVTAVAVPSAVVVEKLAEGAPVKEPSRLEIGRLREIASALLQSGRPPSLGALYPDASQQAREALGAAFLYKRWLASEKNQDSQEARTQISELLSSPEKWHLIAGAPGLGKSQVLWELARQILDEGMTVPLFLTASQLQTWAEVKSQIIGAAGQSAEGILTDDRVCIFIDGWSEFATGEHAVERQTALHALGSRRLIANGRQTDEKNAAFRHWSLEPLSQEEVLETVARASGGSTVSQSMADLLRLPLLLSLHVLSGSDASGTGELLRKFHEQLSRHIPEQFSDVVFESAAALALSGERSYGRFESEIRERAKSRGLSNPIGLLQQLGTLHDRAGKVLAVHDLYWSWLVGRGLMSAGLTAEAIVPLHTRESYELALTSGLIPRIEDVEEAIEGDWVLAASLDTRRGSTASHPRLQESLREGLEDPRLAIRNRAALAVLESGRPRLFARALEILTEVSQAKYYLPEWQRTLRPEKLFSHQVALAQWIGSPGSDVILGAIGARGGPEWVPWLREAAVSGKVSYEDALAAALACEPVIPAWGAPHLDGLLQNNPWDLLNVVERRANRPLAQYIANNYGSLVDTHPVQGFAGWYTWNRLLVSCGNDSTIEALLDQFASLSNRAQELAGYAVIDFGSPWLGRFQRVAFATPGEHRHKRLAEVVDPQIDDATAREWISNGHEEIGWRVLIERHGEEALAELISALPASFGGIQYIPAVSHMKWLRQAPASLVPELMNRMSDGMCPRVVEDMLGALAKVEPGGMVEIVRWVHGSAEHMPVLLVNRALVLYRKWRDKTAQNIGIKIGPDRVVQFDQWIVVHCAVFRWDALQVPMMLATMPEIALKVLEQFWNDEGKVAAILKQLRGVHTFHPDLFERMLASEGLVGLIDQVFATCFDTFPESAILGCLNSPGIKQDILLHRLSTASNPLHTTVHGVLIKRVLEAPINIQHIRYVANILKVHSRYEVVKLLSGREPSDSDGGLWLIREVEVARGERLILESGIFRE